MGKVMFKTVQAGALVAILGLTTIQSAQARGSEVLGAVIGAGAGSMIGREIGGRDGAIVGAAIGAAVGVGVAADHRYGQPVVVQPAPMVQGPVFYPAPVYQTPVYQAPRPYYPPVVVMPGPAIRPPQTVIYAPAPVYVQPGWHHGHHGHRYGYGGGFQQRDPYRY
jgi:hypothetical protein